MLARKWRPRSFEEMVGQEHVLRALVSALDNNRLHHAFLFTGTRGVGKTTLARILARCMNCEQGISSTPCGTCVSCREIDEGRCIDLIEVDAASRTRLEDTRELLDNVQYAPTRTRFKVYLIDEVHMLSTHSFNALLKTLEEPPPHVKFLLATTDAHKVPVTILSRCLQFCLKNMPLERIVSRLQQILDAEQVNYELPALWQLGQSADGSMRDALSLTDQAIAYCNGNLMADQVAALLGTVRADSIHKLLDALVDGRAEDMMAVVDDMAQYSPDYEAALLAIVSSLHRVALAQALPGAVDNSQGDRQWVQALASRTRPEDIQLYYQSALIGRRDLPLAPDPRAGLEMVLLRMLAFRPAGVPRMPPASGVTQGTSDTAAPPVASGSDTRPAAPAENNKQSVVSPPQGSGDSLRPDAVQDTPGTSGSVTATGPAENESAAVRGSAPSSDRPTQPESVAEAVTAPERQARQRVVPTQTGEPPAQSSAPGADVVSLSQPAPESPSAAATGAASAAGLPNGHAAPVPPSAPVNPAAQSAPFSAPRVDAVPDYGPFDEGPVPYGAEVAPAVGQPNGHAAAVPPSVPASGVAIQPDLAQPVAAPVNTAVQPAPFSAPRVDAAPDYGPFDEGPVPYGAAVAPAVGQPNGHAAAVPPSAPSSGVALESDFAQPAAEPVNTAVQPAAFSAPRADAAPDYRSFDQGPEPYGAGQPEYTHNGAQGAPMPSPEVFPEPASGALATGQGVTDSAGAGHGRAAVAAGADVATMQPEGARNTANCQEARQHFRNGNWLALSQKLNIVGIAATLATHCELVSVEGTTILLRLDREQDVLYDEVYRQEIEQALAQCLDSSVTLAIEAGTVTAETPAAWRKRMKAERLEAARQSLRQDPCVQGLVERFAGRLLEDSIEPVGP